MLELSPDQKALQNTRRLASGLVLLAAILLVALVVTCGEAEPSEPRLSEPCSDGLYELQAAAAFYGPAFDEAAANYAELPMLVEFVGETLTHDLASSIDTAFAGAADGFASGSEVIAHMDTVAAMCLES